MNTFLHVPPGFRFHPTDEELVDYYLKKKITSRKIELDVIKDVDLYKIEPWDLQEICNLGTEDQNEWYFFSHKDKKYPTGTRTNRATTAGFWKATGRDKAIYSKRDLIGMRKTLVFYKGRAPNGQKSDYIMHEYRLEMDENGTQQEEGWVVCRVKKKVTTTMHRVNEHESPCWYDDQLSIMSEMDSPKNNFQPHYHHHDQAYHVPHNSCKKEYLDFNHKVPPPQDHHFLHNIPLLDNHKMMQYGFDINGSILQASTLTQEGPIKQNHLEQNMHTMYGSSSNDQHAIDQFNTDWRVLDKYVASQLSHEEVSKQNNYTNTNATNSSMYHASDKAESTPGGLTNNYQDKVSENASTSNSSCMANLWK